MANKAASGLSGPLAEKPLSSDALTEVPGLILDLKSCVRLASALGCETHEIRKLRSFKDDYYNAAFEVLSLWLGRNGDKATGKVLYAALEKSGLKDVADKCRHLLVGESNEGNDPEPPVASSVSQQVERSTTTHVHQPSASSAKAFAVWASSGVSKKFTVALDSSMDQRKPQSDLKPDLQNYLCAVLKHSEDSTLSFTDEPPGNSSDHDVFQLLCITVVALPPDGQCPTPEHLIAQVLINKLSFFLDLDSSKDLMTFHQVFSDSNTCTKFIFSLPSESCRALLGLWFDSSVAKLIQRKVGPKLPFKTTSEEPIIAITENLGHRHWEFPWHRYESVSLRPTTASRGQKRKHAGNGCASDEDTVATCSDGVVACSVLNRLETIVILVREDVCPFGGELIPNTFLQATCKAFLGVEIDNVTFQHDLNDVKGSNLCCMCSLILPKPEGLPYDIKEIQNLKENFVNGISQFLEISDKNKVGVRHIVKSSIAYFFTLSLPLANVFWKSWKERPNDLRAAFYQLVDSSQEPVIKVPRVLGNAELSLMYGRVYSFTSSTAASETALSKQHYQLVKEVSSLEEELALRRGELKACEIHIEHGKFGASHTNTKEDGLDSKSSITQPHGGDQEGNLALEETFGVQEMTFEELQRRYELLREETNEMRKKIEELQAKLTRAVEESNSKEKAYEAQREETEELRKKNKEVQEKQAKTVEDLKIKVKEAQAVFTLVKKRLNRLKRSLRPFGSRHRSRLGEQFFWSLFSNIFSEDPEDPISDASLVEAADVSEENPSLEKESTKDSPAESSGEIIDTAQLPPITDGGNFNEVTTAIEDSHVQAQMDKEWLLANKDILLESSYMCPMEIVDYMTAASRGEFFHPAGDIYQSIAMRDTPQEQLGRLLKALTPSPTVNLVPLFKQALADIYPRFFSKCIHVQDAIESMRDDLDNHYLHEYNKDRPFAWLDGQAETAKTLYLPNLVLLEKSVAETMMSRGAAVVSEEERRDYIYATPAKMHDVRLDMLFQRTNTPSHQSTMSSSDGGMLVAASTDAESLPSQPSLSTSPSVISDNGSSFHSRLALAKHVGIIGGTGCGKTNLCTSITTFYSKCWPMFSLVLFWRLYDPSVQKAENLKELLCAVGPSWTTIRALRLAETLLATAGRGVLVILDGVDQLEADENACIWRLLEGSVLQEARLLVTSRPCFLAKHYFDTYDINLELLGFTEEQVSHFIYHCLGEDLAPKLRLFLHENERLESLMSVPLIARFICNVFQQAPTNPPSTRTALYCKLLALLVRRSISSEGLFILRQEEFEDIMSTLDVRYFDGKVKSLLHELSCLAEIAQWDDKRIFDLQLVKAVKCSRDALKLGLVVRKNSKAKRQYSFLHLTIQEFLVSFGLNQRICSAGKQLLPSTPLTGMSSKSATATTAHDIGVDGLNTDFMKSCLRDVTRQLLSKRHSHVVLQFLAGQVSYPLLPVFFGCLNEWMHQNWCAYPLESKEKTAESRHRLLTCLECVKEASGEEYDYFPKTLFLPLTVRLQHTKTSDVLSLAKAMQNTNNVRELTVKFDYEGESERRVDDKSSRVQTQRTRAMALLLRAVKTCTCVEVLRVRGPSQMNAFFDKEGWRLLCDVVQHTSLKELHVVLCGLGDEDMIELASALKDNQTLTGLNLYNNKIGDGVCAVADVLQTNTTLKWLRFHGNGYGDDKATCDYLHRQLQHIPSRGI